MPGVQSRCTLWTMNSFPCALFAEAPSPVLIYFALPCHVSVLLSMAYQNMAAASAAGWSDAVLITDVSALVKYDEAEQQQARDLVCRAMLMGEADLLWNQALADFRLRRQDFVDRGLWEDVSAEYRRRRDIRLGGSAETVTRGAMSDGSKRARPTSPGGPPPPTSIPPSTTTSTPKASTSNRASNVKLPGPKGPPPPPSPLDSVVVSQAELPTGVTSLLHWSRTLIKFGKFQNKDWTYMDLALNNGKQECSYKIWVMARVRSGGDQLRDLASFLVILNRAGLLPPAPPSPTASSTSSVQRAPAVTPGAVPRADTPTSELSADRTFGMTTPSP